MKKWFIIFILLMSINTVKAANTINDMNIDIYIDNSGTAHIKETWLATLASNSGITEGYKQYYNIDNNQINDYSVTMNGTQFTTIDSWNTSASFNEKAYKAGINHNSDGDEICFGISRYGTNTYILNYTVTNFVNELRDSDMVYWAIIPENFDFSINKIYVKIYADKDFEDNFEIWGYGYDGDAYVYDGVAELTTEHGLYSDEYMVLLLKFPKGFFSNLTNTIDEDFDYYYSMAENGAIPTHISNNNSNNKIWDFFGLAFSVVIGLLTISAVTKTVKKSSTLIGSKTIDFSNAPKKLPNFINNFRDIPCNKDLYEAYWVGINYNIIKQKTNIIGALLLKWLNAGFIEITTVKSKILKKEEKAFIFKTDSYFKNDTEQMLYSMMRKASKDNILEKNEFKNYCTKNYNTLLDWFDTALDYETDLLISKKYIATDINKKPIYIAQPILRQEAIELKGLMQFLKTFTNVDEKSAIEVKLLNEYLEYAALFGIADQVAKEFKKLYPDVLPNVSYDDIIFINYVSMSSFTAATAARSRAENYTAGGGGFSSLGGGGGAFGGGGGGGFR